MYFYYQLTGGDETWKPIQATQVEEIAKLKPTFVTVLQLDTLIPDQPTREVLDKVKYQGSFYIDLDSADIVDSISDAKLLLTKFAELGIEDTDLEIYLSGKKGLHILVPQACFMPKPAPVARLPAIYKELAFVLAVDSLDFKVYTGRKGRMLRTCHNIRENGNYRVPVTAAELRELTPEKYDELCKVPRTVPAPTPAFRWKFAIEYDKAAAKLPKLGTRKTAPPNPETVKRQWGEVEAVFNGEGVIPDAGFNKIALQLCLYARESGWNEDTLVEKSAGILEKHDSDGSRYNTPRKREAELRRMFNYVDDNPAYEYSLGGLKSLLVQKTVISEDGEVSGALLSSGVQHRGTYYSAMKADEAETQISNFVFANVCILKDYEGGFMVAITATLKGVSHVQVHLAPTNFTSSSSLQNAVAAYGGSFTGTDAHARGIYQIMLKEVSFSRFLLDTEGVNVLRITANVDPNLAGQDVIVWADRDGVQVPDFAREAGLELTFQGYPDPNGVIKTDLARSPTMGEYMKSSGYQMAECLKSLFACHPPETIGKILGWMISCHWKQLFQLCYDKFPLLHVYGPAGAGKSELTMSLLHLFYYREEPKSLTPSGTPFSFMTLVAGSASIPVVLDEYKPHRMQREKLEAYRAILRDAYNNKSVSRGGGNRSRDNFNALNVTPLSAPIGFIAEAVETETAIMERSLLVAIRRQSPRAAAEGLRHFLNFSRDLTPLSVLGRHLAGWVVNQWSESAMRDEFDVMHDWALKRFMMQPDDEQKLKDGKLTQEQYARKILGRPRPIYNSTVALFGIVQLRKVLTQLYGQEEFAKHFGDSFKAMANAVYENMDVVAKTSMPEYMKVLQTISDITKLREEAPYTLRENFDYNITEIGGRQILVFHVRALYNKYSAYMRTIGSQPLYPNDASFEIALTETPQFLGYSDGTKSQQGKTMMLDYDELQRGGVPAYTGRAISLAQN